jgi:hypothetical protein
MMRSATFARTRSHSVLIHPDGGPTLGWAWLLRWRRIVQCHLAARLAPLEDPACRAIRRVAVLALADSSAPFAVIAHARGYWPRLLDARRIESQPAANETRLNAGRLAGCPQMLLAACAVPRDMACGDPLLLFVVLAVHTRGRSRRRLAGCRGMIMPTRTSTSGPWRGSRTNCRAIRCGSSTPTSFILSGIRSPIRRRSSSRGSSRHRPCGWAHRRFWPTTWCSLRVSC